MTTDQQLGPHLDADQLNAFAEGALPGPERSVCLRHLAECADCREVAFLAGASLPSEEPARAPIRSRFSWRPAISLGAVGLAAVVIVAVTLHRGHQNPPAQIDQIAVSRSTPAPPREETNAAPLKRGAPAGPKVRFAPKPSPALKAPAQPQSATFGSRQFDDLKASDSAIRSVPPPTTPVPQTLAESGRSIQGAAAGAAARQVQPSPAASPIPTAKAQPSLALRAYQGGLRSPNGSAEVLGSVTDASGAVVAHAKVTLDQTSGAAHRETMTDNSGRFAIASLAPGKYRVEISSPGFLTQVREVDLGTSQLAQMDSKLAVGAVSETVEVQAAAPLMNTESASVQSIAAGKEPLQSSVSSGKGTIALDATGKLLLSKKAGKHWKPVHGPWKTSRVSNLSLTPDQQFKVTTAEGSWLSADGEHWRAAN